YWYAYAASGSAGAIPMVPRRNLGGGVGLRMCESQSALTKPRFWLQRSLRHRAPEGTRWRVDHQARRKI
ncbi:uncharacterized protein METZ01_LOCUS259698, partial [marine metagenome]